MRPQADPRGGETDSPPETAFDPKLLRIAEHAYMQVVQDALVELDRALSHLTTESPNRLHCAIDALIDCADTSTRAIGDAFLELLDAVQNPDPITDIVQNHIAHEMETLRNNPEMGLDLLVTDLPGTMKSKMVSRFEHAVQRFATRERHKIQRSLLIKRLGMGTLTEHPTDPKESLDPALISQAEASTYYNIPKSNLSKAAKKGPGEWGFLWSTTRGRHRYYRRKDIERLAQSRTRLTK